MKNATTKLKKFLCDDDGLTTVENALTGAVVILIMGTFFIELQINVYEKISLITNSLVDDGIGSSMTDCSNSIEDRAC